MLDVAVVGTGSAAVLTLALTAAVLTQIPFGSDAPGSAGPAFYLFVLPFALATCFFTALCVLFWFLRRKGRQPQLSRPDRH